MDMTRWSTPKSTHYNYNQFFLSDKKNSLITSKMSLTVDQIKKLLVQIPSSAKADDDGKSVSTM